MLTNVRMTLALIVLTATVAASGCGQAHPTVSMPSNPDPMPVAGPISADNGTTAKGGRSGGVTVGIASLTAPALPEPDEAMALAKRSPRRPAR